jgi:exonuclease V
MARLHKTSIRVTDIASQYWCEKQMELYALHGKELTEKLKAGKETHEELENEVNVPIVLQPKSYADYLYKNLYTTYMALNALQKNGKTREISVYGSINGYRLVGKIDQLDKREDGILITEDKTRTTERPPSEAQLLVQKIQVIIYWRIMADLAGGLYTANNFKRSYSTAGMAITEDFARQLEHIGVERATMTVDSIAGKLFEMFQSIGKMSLSLRIRYINQFTRNVIKSYEFDYNKKEADGIFDFAMKYWRGERDAMPVPEAETWKCNICTFYGNHCKVWWPKAENGQGVLNVA